jgi:hypothetical protein
MMRCVAWLVITSVGLQSPLLAQDKTADRQASDKVCVAEHPSETLAAIKDRAATCENQQGLPAMLCESQAAPDDRSYLLETATPSETMTRQGPETAIERLNPRFSARLASAIREARNSGLASAGIFSAYRPPSFGVGRFLDRFRSLHAYGLAVDMFGIGEPGSKEAKLWYDIAARHDIVCPYGVDSRREWNHCQPTPIRSVCPDNPLRKTITAERPIDLAEMFKVGDQIIDNPPEASCAVVATNRQEEADAIPPGPALEASLAAPARPGRKHSHEAHDVVDNAFAGARWSDKELMRMVAADMHIGGASHPRKPRRR